MNPFRRAPRSGFPDDILQWLDSFGRHSLDNRRSGIDIDYIVDRFGVLYEYSAADRDGFLAELHRIVDADDSGFVSLGAARLVWEMVGGQALNVSQALPVIDAGINFILARGLGEMMLTGYERQRLVQIHAQGS